MSRTSQIYGHLGVIFGLGGGGSGWQLRIMKVAEKKEEDAEKAKTRNLGACICSQFEKQKMEKMRKILRTRQIVRTRQLFFFAKPDNPHNPS